MSDTTTTVPAATEGEMAHIKQIFERAANAIVQASELSKQVNELQAQFTSLKNDLEHFRQRNAELDIMLSDVRTQRDNAIRDRDEAQHNVDLYKGQYQAEKEGSDKMAVRVERLEEQLHKAQQEADGWMQAAEKSDNDLKAANDTLATLRKALGIVEPKPEYPSYPAQANVTTAATPQSEPYTTTNTDHGVALPEPSKPSSDDTLHTDTPTPWKSW